MLLYIIHTSYDARRVSVCHRCVMFLYVLLQWCFFIYHKVFAEESARSMERAQDLGSGRQWASEGRVDGPIKRSAT